MFTARLFGSIITFHWLLKTLMCRPGRTGDRGTAVGQWLRCCAINGKVAGSIPNGVIGVFIDITSFWSHIALGSTQPLTEMNTSSIYLGGKGGRCVRMTTLPPPCAVVMKSGNLNFLEPSGHREPVMGLLYLSFFRFTQLLNVHEGFHLYFLFVCADCTYVLNWEKEKANCLDKKTEGSSNSRNS